MGWETNNITILIEGLIIVVFGLLLLSFARTMPSSYTLNYEIYPESNELTLQQGTAYTLNIDYKVNTNEALPFFFSTFSPQGIGAKISPKLETYSDFILPLYINVSNIEPGDYPVVLITKVLYGGIVNEKLTQINVKVVPKEKIVFQTTKYTNEQPKLVLEDISTRNILLGAGEKQTLLLKFENTGSASTFSMNAIVDSTDKNNVLVSFNTGQFFLKKGESRNILMTVELDENYAIVYTPIYLYAQEQSTGNQLDLGQINVTLKTQDILIAYNKNLNSVEITNVGTDIVTLDINTQAKTFSMFLQPNQTYFFQADSVDKNADIYLDGNLYKQIDLQDNNLSGAGLDENKPKLSVGKSVSGLFSFGSGSAGWIIFLVVIIVFILIIYKLFFARSAVFGKTVYAKDLKSTDN